MSAPTIARKNLVTELFCKADASFHRYWRWYMYIIVVSWYYLPPLKELPSLNIAALSDLWKLKWKYILKSKFNHSPQDLSSPH